MRDGFRHSFRDRINRLGLVVCTLILLAGTACRRPSDHPVIARVGPDSVSEQDFGRLKQLSRQPPPFESDRPRVAPDPRDLLAELVKERLLHQELQERGRSTADHQSPRDALALILKEDHRPSEAETARWFAANTGRVTRQAQMRFLVLPAPENDAGLNNPDPSVFFARCRAADASAGGAKRWGDLGWMSLGHAPWWPRNRWSPEAVGTVMRHRWPDGKDRVVRAMHYRPPTEISLEHVRDTVKTLMLEEAIQRDIRTILWHRATTTPIEITDDSVTLDPATIVRTEPGPALVTIDPDADRTRGMVRIPGGTFTTGSTEAEIDERVRICQAWVEPALGPGSCARWKYEDEVRRTVTVATFFMDRTEVAWEDYQVFLQATRHRPLPLDGSGAPGFPVAGVSRDDAEFYCRWTGKRLPTADEWEFAARGVEGRRYPWGDQPPNGSRANFCDSRCPRPWHNDDHDDGFAGPAPVGSFPAGATPEGLLDMGGNIREWTATRSGGLADVKGGGFFNAIDDLIAADVRRNNPEVRDATIGFRCAMDPAKSGGE